MTTRFTLPKWYDLHVHLRQNEPVAAYVQAQIDMGCAGVLAMPNTKPPVAKVLNSDPGEDWSIEAYLNLIKEAGGDKFNDIIVPLYLTSNTTPEMIERGAASGTLRACKYYPPHGTTGAEFGQPIEEYMNNGVFKAMEETGTVLCIHGEEHGLKPEKYFGRGSNAEELFYATRVPAVLGKFPKLKIVCEHITTKVAADFVEHTPDNVAATITPQHLLYTTGHLIQGLKYHLFCLPVLKFKEDRTALRKAATAEGQTKFFAGTDSAPHHEKITECGCAAGCFTGGIAPQLYAQGFEEAGLDLNEASAQDALKAFLCTNGANFYGLKIPSEEFTLSKEPQTIEPLKTPQGEVLPLPLGLGENTIPWSLKL